MSMMELIKETERLVERVQAAIDDDVSIESMTLDAGTSETPAKVFVDLSDNTRAVYRYSERTNTFKLLMITNLN